MNIFLICVYEKHILLDINNILRILVSRLDLLSAITGKF